MFRSHRTASDSSYSIHSTHAMDLCSAIVEDAEDARRFSLHPRGAMDLHNFIPSPSAEICRGSSPLPSELTSLVA